VPYTATGPDVALMEQLVQAERPRLYITNSALHNPTGASLSPRVAHRVLGIAASVGMTIVEDDIFADFESQPSPRLAVLDGLVDVIRIGSFSKTLSAAARCGISRRGLIGWMRWSICRWRPISAAPARWPARWWRMSSPAAPIASIWTICAAS
jgi:histidinol-phosphate/aromatic aminotransferase/cobyric acid decarboxylase-like protein